jgi:membrane fusion protein (multidrug efflux system)
MLEVGFTLGQNVQKGQLLVRVDNTIQRVALEQAREALAAAELNLKVTQQLFDERSASEAELTAAQSQASGARTQLESAQKAYEDCQISAPITGYIAQKESAIDVGNLLAGGTLVTRIVDLSSLKATIAIGEMEVGLLEQDMPARVRVPAVGNALFEATIGAIGAGSDPSTGSYPVEVVWENTADHAVKSGMSIQVSIATEEPDSVILIPIGAVVEKDRRDAVFTVSSNRATIRFIEMGRSRGNQIEILDGLKVGDILLTSGITTLARGDSIAVTLSGGNGGSL